MRPKERSALDGVESDLIEVIKGKVPSKANNYRGGRNGWYKNKNVSDYEKSFKLQCTKYKNANIDTWFELYIDVYFETNRQDLDNAFKVVLDCLEDVGAIKNDNKCVRINSEKRFSKDERIEFALIKRGK